MEKYCAVYLDEDHAEVINFQGGAIDSSRIDGSHILAELTEGQGLGSSRAVPSSAVKNKKSTKEEGALDRFFNEVAVLIIDAESVYLFGPAKTKVQFYKKLKKHPSLRNKILAIDQSEYLGLDEAKAMAKKFFENEGLLEATST